MPIYMLTSPIYILPPIPSSPPSWFNGSQIPGKENQPNRQRRCLIMAEGKDRPLESKEERQKTMDKMSVDTSEAETLREGESEEERQEKKDKGNA